MKCAVSKHLQHLYIYASYNESYGGKKNYSSKSLDAWLRKTKIPMLVRADDPNNSKTSYLAMGVSNMQTLYQALVCRFSLRVTQPHLLPICSDSRCICQGSPAVKPSPSFCILPKPTPARATGSQYFQIFFRNYNSKVLHWQMLRNIDEKHTGWSFLSLCPVSLSILLPVLSYPLHSFPFTSFLYILTLSPMLLPFTSVSYLLHKNCSACNKLEEHSCI